MNVGRFSILICVLSFLLVQMVMAQETPTTKPRSGIGNKIFQQTYNADSVREILDNMPYFSLFKDNYFIGGTQDKHNNWFYEALAELASNYFLVEMGIICSELL